MISDKDNNFFEIKLRIGQNQIRLTGEFPQVEVNLKDLLPNLYPLADVIVEAAIAEQDKSVSCRMGCSHCCSQLIPINPAEAHYLAGLLPNLPQPHADRIQRRLDKALKKLQRYPKLYEYIKDPSQFKGNREEIRDMGLKYFSLGIHCPFLKDNKCSIYAYRPMACREYVVTSAPSLCQAPNQNDVECIAIPRTLSSVLYRFSDGKGKGPTEVLALIQFQDYANKHPLEELISLPGKDFLTNIIRALAG